MSNQPGGEYWQRRRHFAPLIRCRGCGPRPLCVAALGPSRTLQELHRRYTRTTPESAPSIDTLKRWSATKKWARLAAAHDEEVARKTAQRVANQQAKRAADLVTHLIAAAAEGLTRAV